MYFRLIMIANCSREKETKDDINDLIRRKYDGLHFVHDLRFFRIRSQIYMVVILDHVIRRKTFVYDVRNSRPG